MGDVGTRPKVVAVGVLALAAAAVVSVFPRRAPSVATPSVDADSFAALADAGSKRSDIADGDSPSGSFDSQIVAFDVASGREKWRHIADTACDSFSPDSAYLACSTRPGRSERQDSVVEVATGKTLHVHPSVAGGKPFFSAKSNYFVYNTAAFRWSLVRTESGAFVTEATGTLPLVSPDESMLVSGREVRSLATRESVAMLPGDDEPASRRFVAADEIAEVGHAPDGSVVAVVYDARNGRERRRWRSLRGVPARALALSPTGRDLVVEWLGAADPLREHPHLIAISSGARTELAGVDSSSFLAFTDDGDSLVFSRRLPDQPRRIVRIQASTGKLTDHADEATALGRTVAIGPERRDDGPPSVRVAEPAGKPPRFFNDAPRRIRAYVLSPDGRTLIIQAWGR